MAIVFNCPHCQERYRLRDDLAGKQAKCKNPECRNLITIPQPVTVPDDADLEAAALAALGEEARAEEQAPAEKVISITCTYCTHQFTVPWSMAGKNTLCTSPECRQRLRVPEPKEDKPHDWRQKSTALPSGARQNFEKLEGVQDAGETKMVSGEALKKAGMLDDEIEPRPLKQKMMFGALIAAFLGSIVLGIVYWMRTGNKEEEDRLMVDARKELDDTKGELVPAEAGLYSAILNTAAAEYALRQNNAEKLKQAHELLGSAREDLRRLAGPTRTAVLGELAVFVVAFGGTDEQVKDQTRMRWQPETSNQAVRVNEKALAVHTELRQTLGMLAAADWESRITIARRLTRALTVKGQAELAADLIPLALFSEAEKDEARAVIALEIYRLDKASPRPREIAEELKNQLAGNVKGNFPTAHTLFTVLAVERKPPLVPAVPPTGPVNDATCLAYVGVLLLEGKAAEAVQLAGRTPRGDTRIKALVLCAEWGDPGSALDAVPAAMAAIPGKREAAQSHILRLSQLAAAAGRHDQSKALCDAINDEGLREWARGEAVHQRVAANTSAKADEAWVEVPATADKLRAGHAWGRLWVARQNAKLSGDRTGEKNATAGWAPPPVHPFALAGIALGLQDR